ILQPAFAAVGRRPRRTLWPGRGSLWAVGAALTVILTGVAALFTVLSRPADDAGLQTFATATGEQRTVELPDGSSIQLNTGTVVEVDYRRDARRLRLVEGEALFDVAEEPSRPF